MDPLRQIEAFTTVVAMGSFVKAADRLGSSKAVVSRLVQDLEARLGTRLLHRTTRRLSLTDAGTDYFERCRRILDELAEADAAASAATVQPRGRLRINVPVSFGNLCLAPLWGRFLERHPDVALDVQLSDRVVDLLEDGYDLAVRIARLPNSTLVSRRLASARIVLCAAPQYLARAPAIRSVADLAEHPVIAYSYSANGDAFRFEGPDGTHEVTIRPRMHSNSGDTCRAVALTGQGLTLQPNFIIGEDLRAGRLVEVLPAYRLPELGIHAVYPSRQHLSLKVRRMVEFLSESLAAPDWE
ncbi:LysR family transcriptional regulator [Xylophilus sp. GW821-FHT01B05]